MLTQIQLNDFQSHVDSTINIGPGLNIISGPSGNGKTAILRAISALIYNNLPGTSAVRLPDGKTYKITVKVENDVIVREKGKKTNSYKLNDTIFNDVGVSVPGEISKVLNLDELDLDGTTKLNINFANQMDAPFLLTAPDTAKMKFLNTIAGTNVIDMAAKSAANKLREEERVEKESETLLLIRKGTSENLHKKLDHLHNLNKYLQDQITQMDSLKKELDTVKDLSARLAVIKNKYIAIQRIKKLLSGLNLEETITKVKKAIIYTQLLQQYHILSNRINDTHMSLQILNKIDPIKYIEYITKAKTLGSLLIKWENLHQYYIFIKTKLQKYCTLNIEDCKKSINNYQNVQTLSSRLATLKNNYYNIHQKLDGLNKDLQSGQKQYAGMLNELKICPICHSSITTQHIEKIIGDLK